MNDKIKELTKQFTAAKIEKYKALFRKNNAEEEYREKAKIFNGIDEQLQDALVEEAKNDSRN